MTYKDEIKYVKGQLSKQGKLLEKVATAIIGDDDFQQKGLLVQVNENSEYIAQDKGFKKKILGVTSALTTLWGVIITIAVRFWKSN